MNWKETLKEINELICKNFILPNTHFNQTPIVNGWLGFPPATDEMIQTKEKELGIELPKSYKDFLKVSNGFRQTSPLFGNLLSVSDIDWLIKKDSDFVEGWAEFAKYDAEIIEEEYLDYGKQQTEIFRFTDLKASILISYWMDGSLMLLNPNVRRGEEWEAWIYANWYPGASRFPSFSDLIQDEYEHTIEALEYK